MATKLTAGGVYPKSHVDFWGPAKTTKSHTALDGRTSEIRTKDQVGADFSPGEPGDVIIESKALSIAYANFDRDPRMVLVNLPDDIDIETEAYYIDENGDPLISPSNEQREQMLVNFETYLAQAIADGKDLFVLDGGTILWEEIRELKLAGVKMGGQTPEGEPRHLPRQFTPANIEMRQRIMQRLYNADIHTILIRESTDVWTGQDKKATDPRTNLTLQQAAGWRRTDRFVDASFETQVFIGTNGSVVQFIPHVCTKISMLGIPIKQPTFAQIYEMINGVPLLLPEDQKRYEELVASPEGVSYG